MTIHRYKISERDIRILQFIWRWKIVPTATLASARFFPGCTIVRGYNRLLDLKKMGLVVCVADETLTNYAWTLTKKGFTAIEASLPALRESGYRSEHLTHDLLVLAFHLGDFLIERPKQVKLFSEQELRRYDSNEFPDWIPSSDLHRPDGYIGFETRERTTTIAIEVELNRKVISAYENVGIFYADQKNVERVLWLVPSIVVAERIQNKINESVSTRQDIHNFVLLSAFKQNGWQASIAQGPESGFSIQQLYTNIGKISGFGKAVERPWNSTTDILLDTRKSYLKSEVSSKSSTTRQPKLTIDL